MNKRIVFIDYIRVIACFLVMLVHSSENFYCWTADTSMLANESNRLWVAIFDGALGRISVPLFMVVSAFLLVPVKVGTTMSDFAHLPDNPLYSHPHIFMLRNHHQGNKHYSWQQMDNRIGKGNRNRVSSTMVRTTKSRSRNGFGTTDLKNNNQYTHQYDGRNEQLPSSALYGTRWQNTA